MFLHEPQTQGQTQQNRPLVFFYDDTELIDSSEKSYYLTDDDIGKKCSIFARIEDYRDGGDLYFLYPEIWFD